MSNFLVHLSPRTIDALVFVITGDSTVAYEKKAISPYRSGPRLVSFFNGHGFKMTYPFSGGLSRSKFTESCLLTINDQAMMEKVIEEAFAPSYFRNTEFSVDGAATYLAPYLKDDGYDPVNRKGWYRLSKGADGIVPLDAPFPGTPDADKQFINEQIEKCRDKIAAGDLTGAITNSRSLVEAVLKEMERRFEANPEKYDGDLQKLYKRVRGLLNIDPKKHEGQFFHTVALGLSNIIDGLAPMRNQMSDAHPLVYKTELYHAETAVNAAMTFARFLLGSAEVQVVRGKLKLVTERP